MAKYSIYDFNIYFKFINSKIDDFEKSFLKKSKVALTHREFSYIVLVGNYPSTPLTKLIEKDSVTKSTFSNQVKTLVKRGYLTYQTKPVRDSRKKYLSLTTTGEDVFEIYRKMRREFFQQYLAFIPEAEREALFEIGLKIAALLVGDKKEILPEVKSLAASIEPTSTFANDKLN